jgi:hypothetical protein
MWSCCASSALQLMQAATGTAGASSSRVSAVAVHVGPELEARKPSCAFSTPSGCHRSHTGCQSAVGHGQLMIADNCAQRSG